MSAVSRDGLTCEYLLPHASGKLKAGVQSEMNLAVTMQPGVRSTHFSTEIFLLKT